MAGIFRGKRTQTPAVKRPADAPELPTVLTLRLVYTSGLVFPPERWTEEAGLGTLSLVIWLRAITYLDTLGGRMVVIQRDPRQGRESTREFPLTADQVQSVLAAMKATGLPARELKLEPLLDSSDRWAHLTLNINTLAGRRSVDVDMNTSSYEGPDAPALRAFLHTLLQVGKADDPGVWYDLTGHWRGKS